MKFMNSKLLAAGAMAVGLALSSGQAWSAAYELDSGVAVPVTITAEVDQTSDVNVDTNIHFGEIGIKQDAVDDATVVIDPTSSAVTEDTAGAARIVTDSGGPAPTAGVIEVTLAFPSTDIHVVYQNPVDLSCGGCAVGNPILDLQEVVDNMDGIAVLTAGTGVQQGNLSGPTEGIGTTSVGGALTFGLGATIATVPGAVPYESGTYAGSVEMLLSY